MSPALAGSSLRLEPPRKHRLSGDGLAAKSCLTLVIHKARQAPLQWDFPGKNAGVDSHSLLQGIFPTQGLNPRRLHCRQILYTD